MNDLIRVTHFINEVITQHARFKNDDKCKKKKYNTIEYDHGIDFIRLSILSSVISHHEISNFPSIKVKKKHK